MAALAEKTKLPAEDASERRETIQLDLAWLSRFLWHSMAVSAWKKVPGTGARYSLRVNPSSGNLHPTETYVALRGFAGMDDGLYHYRADRHAARASQPRRLDAAACPRSRDSLGGGVATDRRTDLDLLARSLEVRRTRVSLLLPRFGPRDDEPACWQRAHWDCPAARWPTSAICASLARSAWPKAMKLPWHFSSFLRRTLRLNFPSRPYEPIAGVPNELSAEEVRYDCFSGFTPRRFCPTPRGRCRAFPWPIQIIAAGHAPLSDPSRDAPLGLTVRRRRSALDFDARTPPMERRRIGTASGLRDAGLARGLAWKFWRRFNAGSKEAPISWRFISTFIACAIASPASIVGTSETESSNNYISAMCSASRLFSASNSPSRETHVSQFP